MSVTHFKFRGIELPPDLQGSLDAYIEEGRPTGSFLQAVLENNLMRAVIRADERSLAALPAIVGYLYDRCPAGCWGSNPAYVAHIEHKMEERKGQKA